MKIRDIKSVRKVSKSYNFLKDFAIGAIVTHCIPLEKLNKQKKIKIQNLILNHSIKKFICN